VEYAEGLPFADVVAAPEATDAVATAPAAVVRNSRLEDARLLCSCSLIPILSRISTTQLANAD
jgi:hypothetical protein